MYALILAGGKGERLRPLTDNLPKSMVPVHNKPLIWHQLNWLDFHGITNVVILGGYSWEAIRDFISENNEWNIEIEYSIESTPLGRGGAIKNGLSNVPSSESAFVALNGDEISGANLGSLIDKHNKSNNVATIVLAPLRSPYGVVDVTADDKITGFREKAELPFWVSSGIYVMNRVIEVQLPDQGDHEDTTFPRLADKGRLGAFRTQEMWQTVNNLKELKDAEAALEMNKHLFPWIRL